MLDFIGPDRAHANATATAFSDGTVLHEPAHAPIFPPSWPCAEGPAAASTMNAMRAKAIQQLARHAPRLEAEARRACEREGVEPDANAVRERIAARLCLADADIADILFRTMHARARLATWTQGAMPDGERSRIHAIANRILAARERDALPRGPSGAPEGRVARHARLETSAHRKLAAVLALE